MVLILFVAAILSFVLRVSHFYILQFTETMQDWVEGGVIMAVVVVNVVIGFTEEYKAEKTMQQLKELTVPTATVVRQGERDVVEATQLVPGLHSIYGNQENIQFKLHATEEKKIKG